jgi:hypothetical protein
MTPGLYIVISSNAPPSTTPVAHGRTTTTMYSTASENEGGP